MLVDVNVLRPRGFGLDDGGGLAASLVEHVAQHQDSCFAMDAGTFPPHEKGDREELLRLVSTMTSNAPPFR